MRAVKVIRDPKAFKILADDTRRRVVFLLRVKERTVSQIAEELGKTPQVIYHHIRKLLDAGMVEVAKEERVDHFIETYYQATAEVFHCTCGGVSGQEDSRKYAVEHEKEALQALPKLGFDIQVDEDTVSRLVDLQRRMENLGGKQEWTEKAEELEDVDLFAKQSLTHYATLLSMSNEQFEELCGLEKEFRDLLRSRLAKPVLP
ncbi:MAG: helix-turn-helix domain-containing protein [Anaerolineae bacterium]|nr:helix-turn-helix domain-containing protein [Anaerolineae bacterium]NIN97365.1 helix-turn-helix domain-containing protein [Anaerolineae bacterium]NIQ78383.1 helix-turn-helix domain-containing protein [Anaerolineae bacterium]